jgi:hypothetical protein
MKEELPVDQIIVLPILFQVPVMNYAVKRGRWVILGNAPLEGSLLNPPPRFMQDALRKDSFIDPGKTNVHSNPGLSF